MTATTQTEIPWLSGSVTYTNGPHSISFQGMGNLSHTAYQTLATPIQNNSTMYVLEYTYTKGCWIAQPYYQYSNVPTDQKVGIVKGASTNGGALLLSLEALSTDSLSPAVENTLRAQAVYPKEQ